MSGKKKMLLALLCALLLCALRLAAIAEEGVETDVDYIKYAWNGTERTSEKKTCGAAIVLTGGETTLSTGWYVANTNVSFSSRPTVNGDVRLILMDGCSVTANSGIQVQGDGSSLTIYAQSEGESTGALAAAGSANNAAIGGGNQGSGTITIHGGKIDATTVGYGAGIGGGCYGSGEVTIFGGTVSATTGGYGAAIGGGIFGGGTIAIHGGAVTVSVTNKDSICAGIGGGAGGSGAVTITGGTVTAAASGFAAAIGAGNDGSGSAISLSWTKAGDSITADSYRGTVELKKTSKLIIQDTKLA